MSTQQSDVQWFHAVQAAFPDEELRKRIWVEAHQPTQLPRLFEDLSRYVLSLNAQQQQQQQSSHDMPTNLKKRKLEDGSSQTNGTATAAGIANAHVMFEYKDVSVQIPARKKLRVQLVGDSLDARRSEVRLVNPNNDDTESSLPGESIEQVFCLPVPDKQQRQSYFALLPKQGASTDGKPAEQILFTLNDTPQSDAGDETNVSSTRRALSQLLARYDKDVTVPDAGEFASSRPQHHRKGEKGYHVNAHRGSKEGYLFFLPTGILFGFKKPLIFYPFHAIESISYTSVLQRTFNLVIAASKASAHDAGSEDVEETEFSMLDQEDFAGIDEYVKRHGLNDASLAAGRRAKEYGVNKDKAAKGEAAVNGENGGSETELQRAEQELQDEEDEEEEDYEASGGESDGEGESSGEEDDGDGEGYEEADGEEDDEGEVEGEADEEDEL